MNRVFHPYWLLEDFKSGMWTPGKLSGPMLERAIAFTGDHVLYGSYMLRVGGEWPISAEQNLTDTAQNRKAWIGHAACFLAIQCPENVTRKAWGFLSAEQQDLANRQAQNAIEVWEVAYQEKNTQLRFDLGEAWLSGRDSRRSAAHT